ncbi:RNA-directed DNA polymerase from transposon x-element-like protein-related [Anaeramoeba ignava]|uniref:RNA-directed DNA polymerase from transposon x-element-like protein-related n=1 Tax=Anaeramoeba ignava TaxID=1746090 RepID=A0A9Q0RDZ7_ANAIG|nr:RNA-directed DNA polymerase from transposon x-element-like protein-related [Anaeramoeba ignava]
MEMLGYINHFLYHIGFKESAFQKFFTKRITKKIINFNLNNLINISIKNMIIDPDQLFSLWMNFLNQNGDHQKCEIIFSDSKCSQENYQPQNSPIDTKEIFYIYKQGDETKIANYRQISINQALPRIFLKTIYKNLEKTWDNIDKKQFGFRKYYDTRIATIELQKELKKHNSAYIIQLDIKKCFDTIDHTLIKTVIDKYAQHIQTKKFLIKYYNNNDNNDNNYEEIQEEKKEKKEKPSKTDKILIKANENEKYYQNLIKFLIKIFKKRNKD